MRQKSWDNRSHRSTLGFFATIIAIWVAASVAAWAILHKSADAATQPAFLANPDWPAITYFELSNVRVIDGDTLEADINFPLSVTLRKESIRCVDYDAWESSKRRRTVDVSDEEVTKGKAATEALRELLKQGSMVAQLESGERDVYGRVLARLFVEVNESLVSVSTWMEARGHIRTTETLR